MTVSFILRLRSTKVKYNVNIPADQVELDEIFLFIFFHKLLSGAEP